MKTSFTFAFLALSFVFTSFKSDTISTFDKFGFYLGGNPDNSPVSLKINEDHTYNFCDYSKMDKPIKITGIWNQDGNLIILEGNENIKFHSKWKIDPECTCLKSQKGLTFYRLCQ